MKYFFTALMMLLVAGCSGSKIPLPPQPGVQALLQQLASEGERWQQLDAAAKVGFERAGKYMSTQQFMLLERPDRLRVDVLSLFNQLALQLTVSQGELQVFLNTTVPGQFYRGPASDELLARFTRLPLSAKQLIRLLLYAPPVAEGQTARVEIVEDRYRLELTNGDGDRQQQFFFDEQLRLRSGLYLRNAEILLRVDYSKIDKEDNFPRRIQIEIPAQQTKVTVSLSDVRLNQPVNSSRFQLTPPANAVPLQLPGFNISGGQ